MNENFKAINSARISGQPIHKIFNDTYIVFGLSCEGLAAFMNYTKLFEIESKNKSKKQKEPKTTNTSYNLLTDIQTHFNIIINMERNYKYTKDLIASKRNELFQTMQYLKVCG